MYAGGDTENAVWQERYRENANNNDTVIYCVLRVLFMDELDSWSAVANKEEGWELDIQHVRVSTSVSMCILNAGSLIIIFTELLAQ